MPYVTQRAQTKKMVVYISTPIHNSSKKKGHFGISTSDFSFKMGLREARTVRIALNKFFDAKAKAERQKV